MQVCLDVAQFKPNEITVKTVENSIIVEGKHEERQDDHGYISRQFTRKYLLPKDYDPNTVVSSLSSDGVLSIKAPLPQKLEDNKERIISIQQTGPAKASIKPNPEHDDGKKK
jgi:HSP20 family molecular chaperone IbpA